MSEQWQAIRPLMAAVADNDPSVRALYDDWRIAVARDTVAEMAAAEQFDLLCGPFPAECDGRLRVNGIGVECPLFETCERRGQA